MFKDQGIQSFLEALAARTPTPGGGAAGALSCATGAAQACMCAAFTTGRKKYAAIEPRVRALQGAFTEAQTAFLELMDRDALAYDQVLAARRLPEGSESERSQRALRVAEAEEIAVQVPERILKTTQDVLIHLEQLAGLCNPNLLADVAVAAWLLEAGARSAALQARGNLKDRSDAGERVRAAALGLKNCQECVGRIVETVVNGMGLTVDTP